MNKLNKSRIIDEHSPKNKSSKISNLKEKLLSMNKKTGLKS